MRMATDGRQHTSSVKCAGKDRQERAKDFLVLVEKC